MNRFGKFLSWGLFGLLPALGIYAQEEVTPLAGKPPTTSHGDLPDAKKSASSILLELPLMDDFSNYLISPDPDIWSDNHVYVNNNFGIDPVSYGVATLDVLDADGSIYPHAKLDPATFIADVLTSHPVQLLYPPSDSIYLSFFYQPRGLGEPPDETDSLSVDFFDPGPEEWIKVWGAPGKGNTFHPFRQVMIPIREEKFLQSGFRFRFRNRASLPSNPDYPDSRANVDHWHVDYIRLDRNRFLADTVIRDVAITSGLQSMLKDYSSIPWTHYEQAFTTIFNARNLVRYRNNDSITHNITRSITIRDQLFGETLTTDDPTAQDIPAYQDTSVVLSNYFPFSFNRGDSAVFLITAFIRTDELDHKLNDTVLRTHVFKDYFAYDDGSAEAGYGLRGHGTENGAVAVKYKSFIPDLLGGVDIYFNQLYDSVNLDYYFKLMVWDDKDGQPGTVIWEDDNELRPVYSDNLNQFRRFNFTSPVPVSDTFYVGWKQYNEYMLNVGLDRNSRPASTTRYVKYQANWKVSSISGIIMFRPFVYQETSDVAPGRHPVLPIQIFPNPADNIIRFNITESGVDSDIHIELFDAAGRMADHGITRVGQWDVSTLPEGIYFLRVRLEDRFYSTRLLINR